MAVLAAESWNREVIPIDPPQLTVSSLSGRPIVLASILAI